AAALDTVESVRTRRTNEECPATPNGGATPDQCPEGRPGLDRHEVPGEGSGAPLRNCQRVDGGCAAGSTVSASNGLSTEHSLSAPKSRSQKQTGFCRRPGCRAHVACWTGGHIVAGDEGQASRGPSQRAIRDRARDQGLLHWSTARQRE